MTRPENIRCETCVFWRALARDPDDDYGVCHQTPLTARTHQCSFCGEWRDTWPADHMPFKAAESKEAKWYLLADAIDAARKVNLFGGRPGLACVLFCHTVNGPWVVGQFQADDSVKDIAEGPTPASAICHAISILTKRKERRLRR